MSEYIGVIMLLAPLVALYIYLCHLLSVKISTGVFITAVGLTFYVEYAASLIGDG